MKIEFGTDGIRGLSQVDLTPTLFYNIGTYLGLKTSKPIVIAYDTRESSLLYYMSIVVAIRAQGIDVITLNIASTPLLAKYVKDHDIGYGVMITASHNPYRYNGIKIFDSDGKKIDIKEQKELTTWLNNKAPNFVRSIKIGRLIDNNEYQDEYLYSLTKRYSFPNIKNKKIFLDGSNGATYLLLPKLTKLLNLNNSTLLGINPDGQNINKDVGSLNIANIQKTLAIDTKDFLLGSFDGDGDRFILADQKRIYDGDILAYLLVATNINRYKTGVVITPNSNRAIIKAFETLHIPIYETSVGDENVLKETINHRCNLGYEPSGHFIIDNEVSDGIKTLLLVLDIFDKHPKKISSLIKKLHLNKVWTTNFSVKDSQKFIEQFEEKKIKNELLSLLGKNGFVLLRKSGTEKLIRLKLECPNQKQLNKAIAVFKKFMEEYKCAE